MKRNKTIMFILITALLCVPIRVYADTVTSTYVQIEFGPGSLSMTVPDDTITFDSITLDGKVQTVSASFESDMLVTDLTGSGNGWYVTAHAAPMNNGSGKTLSGRNLTLEAIHSVTPLSGSSATPPKAVAGAPYVIDGASPVKVFGSAAGEGMGQYTISFSANALKLTMNTNNVNIKDSNHYTTGIYWSIVSGP